MKVAVSYDSELHEGAVSAKSANCLVVFDVFIFLRQIPIWKWVRKLIICLLTKTIKADDMIHNFLQKGVDCLIVLGIFVFLEQIRGVTPNKWVYWT